MTFAPAEEQTVFFKDFVRKLFVPGFFIYLQCTEGNDGWMCDGGVHVYAGGVRNKTFSALAGKNGLNQVLGKGCVYVSEIQRVEAGIP